MVYSSNDLPHLFIFEKKINKKKLHRNEIEEAAITNTEYMMKAEEQFKNN